MPLPSVSVILPNYNQAYYLPQCLRAILSQSVKPKELIIIDDKSTDNSVDIILELASQEPIIKVVLNEQNIGAFPSTLKACEQATGDYLFFQAADDYLLPGFFEKTLMLLEKYPQAGLCSSLSRRINQNEDYIDTVPEAPYISELACYKSPQMMQNIMLKHNNWGIMPSTALFNRKMVAESRALTLEAGGYADAFLMTLLSIKHGVCFLPEELAVFRLLPGSFSAKARTQPDDFLKLVSPMWRLMETTYTDQFPPELRKSLIRGNLYTYGNMSLNQINKAQGVFLADLKVSLKEPNLIDKFFLFGILLFGEAQFWITKFYLFLRLRRVSGDLVIRVLHRLRNSIKRLSRAE